MIMRQLLKKLLAPLIREVIKEETTNKINSDVDFEKGRWWGEELHKPANFYPQDADSDNSFGVTREV